MTCEKLQMTNSGLQIDISNIFKQKFSLREKESQRDEISIATGFNPWIILRAEEKSATYKLFFIYSIFWRAFQDIGQLSNFVSNQDVVLKTWAVDTTLLHFFQPGLKPRATTLIPVSR